MDTLSGTQHTLFHQMLKVTYKKLCVFIFLLFHENLESSFF